MAGVLRFELKTSVLETGVLPIETTRLCDLGLRIADCGFIFQSAIHNPQSQIGMHRGRFELPEA